MLGNLKIGWRLSLGFGALVTITAFVGILSLSKMNTLADLTSEMYNHSLTVSNAVRDVRENINAIHNSMKDVVLADTQEKIDQAVALVEQHDREVHVQFDIVFERFWGDIREVENAHTAFEDWKDIRDEVIALSKEGKKNEAAGITRGKCAEHVLFMSDKIQKMISFANLKADEFLNNAERQRREVVLLTTTFLVTLIILGIILAFYIVRSIVNPLQQLVKNAHEISIGDVSGEISLKRKDEIGTLADSIRELQADLKSKIETAEKIAAGNFGFDIVPRSDKDMLGKSFCAMISSLRVLTRELRERESKYRTLTENLNVGVYRNTPGDEGYFIEANPEMIKMFGYEDKDEFLSIKVSNTYVNPKNRVLFNKKITKHGYVKNEELHFKRKDGSQFIASDSAVAVKNKKGEILYFDGIIVDITERKKAEEELQIKTRLNTILLDAFPCVALLLRPKTREIIVSNEAARKIGAVPGTTCYETWAQRNKPCPWCKAPDVWSKKGLQHEFIEDQGVHWNAYWIPVSDDLYMHFVFDITGQKNTENERKSLEEQLFQAQKMESIGRLAGGIAHDFNNILAGIMGYAELLKLKFPDESSLEGEAAVIILKGTERASELTSQLLGFARRGKYNPLPLNINDLIKEYVKITEKIFEKSVKVNLDLYKDVYTIEADSRQIGQVITNLIINAKDAMPHGGTLTIITKNVEIDKEFIADYPELIPGKYVSVTVSDSGTGIPESIIGKVFEPFFTTKSEGKGTGLGLATVYGIVKNHGGYIYIDSRPDEETTFRIYFPYSVKEVDYTEKKYETYKGSGTVLLVDDEENIRKTVTKMLNGLGYKTLFANNGNEALELYKRKMDEIDIVLLDMIMPEKGGAETFFELKKINPDIKVLLSSGYSKAHKAAKIIRNGAAGFIQKPYKGDELSKKIMKIMDQMPV